MKIFISHSSKDKKFVRKLKNCLAENSIETWFDEGQLELGDSLVDKLEEALDDSSHLVIILSPSSVESDWVKYELDKAIKNSNTGLMNKIIPVKYRNCEIPETLTDLLYADLSNEVVLPDGNEVKFISDGFDSFFLKLVRAIRNSAKAISKREKKAILSSFKQSEDDITIELQTKHRGNYKLIGYNTFESRLKHQNIIANEIGRKKNINDLRPVLLPPNLKELLNLKIGDKITFWDGIGIMEGHGEFAGYRNDDLAITIDRRTRDTCYVESQKFYQIEVDSKDVSIQFVSEIK